MSENVVVIIERLRNENGNGYGDNYIIFAKTEAEAQQWISDNFTDECRYRSRGVWEQLHFEIVVPNPDNTMLYTLLEAFRRKHIGPSVLKKVAKMEVIWKHNDYDVLVP
jgi:hypothetical protein